MKHSQSILNEWGEKPLQDILKSTDFLLARFPNVETLLSKMLPPLHPMNFNHWIRPFERNQQNRPEPSWDAPLLLDSRTKKTTLPSLEQFALGDGGGPACLIALDAERFQGASEEMRTAVNLWFREEREHARLLSCAARRLGGYALRSHWSFSAFCLCRRVMGVRFELQVLLLTELVSTAYYKVLQRHVPDEPIRRMRGLILRDEAGHLAS